jgi:hypothetical protein
MNTDVSPSRNVRSHGERPTTEHAQDGVHD